MDLGLAGKSVFVAAASKGLGKASALAFAKEGAKVTIASRNTEQLEKARDEIREAAGQEVGIVQMDVLDPKQIQEAIRAAADAQGGLDVLVTNAGGPPGGSFSDFKDEDWERGFELTLLSTVRMIREALPYLKSAKEGRIVNIASSSIKQPIPGLILSNVFRAGIQGLTKSLSQELAEDGILINTVAPGRIATERIMQLDRLRADEQQRTVEDILAEANRQIALGRTGTPEEFGRIVAFYGSLANTYMTGQSILVDGGLVKAL
ncbi:SDR family oxidoreductase [Marinicrinis lubricantis]|uniref:SDR family oxidoreductase n=1 Tax=Marinicrinis lubricantis TaxID=2086470 RepID=A0ABW1ISU4_9BACL